MKKLFLTLILLSGILFANGQNMSDAYKYSMPQVTYPSPQSQIFQKYINHEITEYNGLPQIEIPLYEIKIKGIAIPVTLSYHAGGIKYQQYDGDVGAGWSVNVGGYRASRTVYGKPDEMYKMYDADKATRFYADSRSYERDDFFASVFTDLVDSEYTGSVATPLSDGEYDQFTYNLPSSNGHFFITDRNSYTVQIAEENLDKIKLNINSRIISNMEITDGSGFKYYLGNYSYEKSFEFGNYIDTYTGWPLKRITSPHNENINFTYNKYRVFTDRMTNVKFDMNEAPEIIDNEGFYSYDYSTGLSSTGSYTDACFIDEIKSDNVRIKFFRKGVYSNSGTITPLFDYILDRIEVYDLTSGKRIKKITFSQSLKGNAAGIFTPNWHLLLDAILIAGETDSMVQKYKFDYYIPVSTDYLFPDLWRHYTYVGNKGKIINELFISSAFSNDLYAYESNRSTSVPKTRILDGCMFDGHATKYIDRYNSNTSMVNGSDRFPVVSSFSLKKITFPTGGSTEYIYGLNRCKGYNNAIIGIGQRVEQIISTTTDGSPVVTKYKYGENEDGLGLLNEESSYWGFFFDHCFVQCTSYFRKHSNNPAYPDSDDRYMTRTVTRSYSNQPSVEDYDLYSRISYSKIARYETNAASGVEKGKTISRYDIPKEYRRGYFDTSSGREHPYKRMFTEKYHLGTKPLLRERYYLDNNNDTIQIENYIYTYSPEKEFKGLKGFQEYFFEDYAGSKLGRDFNKSNPYDFVTSIFNCGFYSIYIRPSRLTSKTNTLFASQKKLTTTETYTYDSRNRLTKTVQSNSNGRNMEKEFTYPASGALVTNNIIGDPVKTRTKHNNVWIGTVEHIYPATAILPSETRTSSGDGSVYRTELTYSYDTKGNIRQVTGLDGVSTVYLWGYRSQYPIAEIKYATFAQVIAHVNEATLNSIAAKAEPSATDWTLINNLRSKLSNSFVTTYTYKPLIGIKTVTDPSGNTTTYEYDTFNRLEFIKDRDLKKVQENKYNYKNQ